MSLTKDERQKVKRGCSGGSAPFTHLCALPCPRGHLHLLLLNEESHFSGRILCPAPHLAILDTRKPKLREVKQHT